MYILIMSKKMWLLIVMQKQLFHFDAFLKFTENKREVTVKVKIYCFNSEYSYVISIC